MSGNNDNPTYGHQQPEDHTTPMDEDMDLRDYGDDQAEALSLDDESSAAMAESSPLDDGEINEPPLEDDMPTSDHSVRVDTAALDEEPSAAFGHVGGSEGGIEEAGLFGDAPEGGIESHPADEEDSSRGSEGVDDAMDDAAVDRAPFDSAADPYAEGTTNDSVDVDDETDADDLFVDEDPEPDDHLLYGDDAEYDEGPQDDAEDIDDVPEMGDASLDEDEQDEQDSGATATGAPWYRDGKNQIAAGFLVAVALFIVATNFMGAEDTPASQRPAQFTATTSKPDTQAAQQSTTDRATQADEKVTLGGDVGAAFNSNTPISVVQAGVDMTPETARTGQPVRQSSGRTDNQAMDVGAISGGHDGAIPNSNPAVSNQPTLRLRTGNPVDVPPAQAMAAFGHKMNQQDMMSAIEQTVRRQVAGPAVGFTDVYYGHLGADPHYTYRRNRIFQEGLADELQPGEVPPAEGGQVTQSVDKTVVTDFRDTDLRQQVKQKFASFDDQMNQLMQMVGSNQTLFETIKQHKARPQAAPNSSVFSDASTLTPIRMGPNAATAGSSGTSAAYGMMPTKNNGYRQNITKGPGVWGRANSGARPSARSLQIQTPVSVAGYAAPSITRQETHDYYQALTTKGAGQKPAGLPSYQVVGAIENKAWLRSNSSNTGTKIITIMEGQQLAGYGVVTEIRPNGTVVTSSGDRFYTQEKGS